MTTKRKETLSSVLNFLLSFLLIVTFSGCGVENDGSGATISSSEENHLDFPLPKALGQVSDMSATLTISGVGTYNMTINSDNMASVTVPGVPEGLHTFTITYYYQEIVVLATTSTSATVRAGKTTKVSFSSSPTNSDFDDDGDGVNNLDEVKAGTDPDNAAPDGAIDTPTETVTIAQGESVNFTGTGTDPDNNTPLTYLWDFGGGATSSTEEDPGDVTFDTAGTYTVTFTVTDSQGQVGTTHATVMVNALPDGTIDALPSNVTILPGTSLTFNGTGSDADENTPLTYAWDFGGGAANSTEEDPGDVTFNIPGTYTVTFTVTDNKGLSDLTPAVLNVKVGNYFLSRYDTMRYGDELWFSDGSSAGTVMVKNITVPMATEIGLFRFTYLNGAIYFPASDGTNGDELWKSNGTDLGTVMVKNINPGADSSNPWFLTNVGGTLYFRADDGINGRELWKSDGTEGGTMMVKDINPADGSGPLPLTHIDGTLYFRADDGINGIELWKSDGTKGGTVMVKDITPGAGSSGPMLLARINGTLYFRADDGINGNELWKSDSTEGSTMMVKDITPGAGNSWPTNLINVDGTLYFQASNGANGVELWKSDGTKDGTMMVKDINPIGDSSPSDLFKMGGMIVFSADDGTFGYELWKSDGTEEGTVKIKEN